MIGRVQLQPDGSSSSKKRPCTGRRLPKSTASSRHRERAGGNDWWIGGAAASRAGGLAATGRSLHAHCKPAEDKARYQADDEGYLRFEHATDPTFYAMHANAASRAAV
jgi:hypothetical protein